VRFSIAAIDLALGVATKVRSSKSEDWFMHAGDKFLSPSQAAEQLGVSAKALRLYEQNGLLKPIRTPAGWRTYGPAEMEQAADVAALRALGFSFRQIGRVLRGDSDGMETALAAHQASLEQRIRRFIDAAETIRSARVDLAQGKVPSLRELAHAARPASKVEVAFDLPWPWGGERFELRGIRPLNYITGPLFSGKTRLAHAIADNLPATTFVGLDRSASDDAPSRMSSDRELASRVNQALSWMVEDGATASRALLVLIAIFQADNRRNLVIDMVEQGLDQPTQEALIAYLRAHVSLSRSIFLLTRSSAILDLAAVGADESIILCPANHSPPTRVLPYPGAPGYEAVASCLALPDVRARTAGVIAVRSDVA
jgi:DNA-binding transcriptional MerR regulator